MRPTGRLHIGHYFGAIQNWLKLQDEFECFFFVADWHALMSDYEDTSKLVEYSEEMVADWIACGLDPKKSTIFVQSAIPEHAELHLILSTLVPVAWLERCPTYKEALENIKNKDITNYAFLGYPVLQTADIILYKANVVPVGEDQMAHLEMCREIVRRFNANFKKEVFPEPTARLTPVPRLLGTDGRKMSKSYGNAIELSEEEESIRKKGMAMFTDPARIKRTDPGHPDKCNVFSYHQIFNKPDRIKVIESDCKTAKIGCVDCKKEQTQNMLEFIKPIREKRTEILKDRGQIQKIIREGNEKARSIAQATMREVRSVIFR